LKEKRRKKNIYKAKKGGGSSISIFHFTVIHHIISSGLVIKQVFIMNGNSTSERTTSASSKPKVLHPHDLQHAIQVRINFINHKNEDTLYRHIFEKDFDILLLLVGHKFLVLILPHRDISIVSKKSFNIYLHLNQ